MNEDEVLSKVKKKVRHGLTKRYGVFGLSLGQSLYEKLDKYCLSKDITKAGLIKLLLTNYLEDKDV